MAIPPNANSRVATPSATVVVAAAQERSSPRVDGVREGGTVPPPGIVAGSTVPGLFDGRAPSVGACGSFDTGVKGEVVAVEVGSAGSGPSVVSGCCDGTNVVDATSVVTSGAAVVAGSKDAGATVVRVGDGTSVFAGVGVGATAPVVTSGGVVAGAEVVAGSDDAGPTVVRGGDGTTVSGGKSVGAGSGVAATVVVGAAVGGSGVTGGGVGIGAGALVSPGAMVVKGLRHTDSYGMHSSPSSQQIPP